MALLTQKTVKFVGIASLVIVTALGGVVVGQPLYNHIKTQSDELSSTQEELATAQKSRNGLEEAKSQYPAISEINAQLTKKFPDLANVPGLLDTLTAGAVQSGMAPSDITAISFSNPTVATPVVPATTGGASGTPSSSSSSAPSAAPSAAASAAPSSSDSATGGAGNTSVATGSYADMEIGISAQGSPENIQKFLDYLNKMDRAMTINTFSVTQGDSENGKGAQLSLTGKVYIYKKISTPSETEKQNTQGTNNSATGTTNAPTGTSTGSATPSNG